MAVTIITQKPSHEIETETYPSSSSASRSYSWLIRATALTEIFGVGVQAVLSLIVQKQVVHPHLLHQQACCGQLVVSQLHHGHLLVQHRELAEAHLRLHSVEALEVASLKSLFEGLLEPSGEHMNENKVIKHT